MRLSEIFLKAPFFNIPNNILLTLSYVSAREIPTLLSISKKVRLSAGPPLPGYYGDD